ncbi:apical junction molecule-like [Impatiens glandulifera]|uniref:apical junction molecule-like n=1 Tax=Impatiens glandulifera TaxID=253017 RepID=UPI001FB180A5|nr:apical junction molecule-like [Impatiens glandulifera]
MLVALDPKENLLKATEVAAKLIKVVVEEIEAVAVLFEEEIDWNILCLEKSAFKTEAVEEFFNTATLSDNKITATVSGTEFELTEESVVESLRLPTVGQDAQLNLELKTFEAACQILSATKEEPVKVSSKKATLRLEYIPLCDIFTKSVQARGGNYNSLTKAKIEMLVGLIQGSSRPPAPQVAERRKSAKKAAPAKEKTGNKGKEKIVFLEPPSQTRDEDESASSSERTDSQKTDEERSNEEEHSRTSSDNTGAGANIENAEASEEGSAEEEEDDQKKADFIASRILEDIERRAEAVGELYREWHEYRFDRLYKHMLPGLTDEECFRRLKEIEETVMSLTNAETIHEALGRTTIIRPRARLQKLTVRIRKIKERYVEGSPEANLQLLVLEKLEAAKGDLAEEIDRLEAAVGQRGKQHSLASETDHGATPPRADPVINEADERTETPITAQLDAEQHGVSEPGVTKEWVKNLLQEFANSTVHPLEEKMKRTVSLAHRFANKTKHDLVKGHDRISQIEADYRDEVVLRNNHLQRTEALEDTTSRIKDDLDRLERETEQGFTEVDEDLGWRVTDLENKNASLEDRNNKLEADLKALTAQVDEIIKAKVNADIAVVEANARVAKEVQDALDEEARREKEPPQLTEEERAKRERRTMAKYPGLEESVAAQQREDVERLNAQKQGLEEFATAQKKKKTAAPSSSVPAKRKRKSSKKAQVAGLLDSLTESVIESQPDQATHTEDEDEEHLERRPTRQRVSRPDKKKRTKDMMAAFNFSDSE